MPSTRLMLIRLFGNIPVGKEVLDGGLDIKISHIADYLVAAGVTIQKHGRWMWEGRFKACSECGSYIDWNDTLGANHWRFCPYCGAKMDGEEAQRDG